MSQWTDRVRAHPAWEQMKSLGPLLDQALAVEGIDPAAIGGVERLRSVLTFAGKRLAGTDPQLVHTGPLDAIAASMQAAANEMTAYPADVNIAHIDNANSHADAILAQLATINYPFVADDFIAIRDAGVEYQRTLERQLEKGHATVSKFSVDATELDRRLGDLKTAVESENTRLIALATDFEARFIANEAIRDHLTAEKIQAALAQAAADVAAVQQRLTELGTEIGNERTRLTTVGAEFQSQFSTAQETRLKEFSEAQTGRQDRFAALVTDYTQKLSDQNVEFLKQRDAAFLKHDSDVAELRQKYTDSAETILEEIEVHKTAVEKLVGVIGNLGVTSGYQKVANYARTATIIWQGIAVGAMLFVIYFALEAFLPLMQTHQQFDWQNFAGRVVLTAAVGVLAAYAAAQSDKYFEMELRNRKLALELEAIGPYLAPLPAEQQAAFRLQIGERTFGRDELATGRRRADKSPATAVDVLMKSKELRDLIRDIVAEVVQAIRPKT